MCWFNEFPKYNSINNDERIWGIDYNNKSSNEKKSGSGLLSKNRYTPRQALISICLFINLLD